MAICERNKAVQKGKTEDNMFGKFLISAALSLAAVCFGEAGLAAQTGPWTGKLKVSGTELALVFNIGEQSSTLDVPDQGAKGIPVKVTKDGTGTVILDIPKINASFKGLWLEKMIAGTFTQHGMSFPLTLAPGKPVINRPQTPAGPFPYTTEEVTFSNGDAVLKGTLTLPENCGETTPALVMVTGSGLQNRDEEIFSHKPFAVIADAFARAGIATLRYDDRGFGESNGDVVFCTTEDLKNDALAGVELLRKRFGRVGALGHSEGGSIALMLASGKKVDFVISLAGGITPMGGTLVAQNRRALLQAGCDTAEVDEYCRLLSDTFSALTASTPLPSPDGYAVSDALKQNYRLALQQFQTPYMKYFVGLDISKILPQVTCPVMGLNGTLDSQVDCESNLKALKEKLPVNPKTVIRAEEGLNHLFQHCTTGEVSEYKTIEETFSPAVLSAMAAWVNGLQE